VIGRIRQYIKMLDIEDDLVDRGRVARGGTFVGLNRGNSLPGLVSAMRSVPVTLPSHQQWRCRRATDCATYE